MQLLQSVYQANYRLDGQVKSWIVAMGDDLAVVLELHYRVQALMSVGEFTLLEAYATLQASLCVQISFKIAQLIENSRLAAIL